MAGLLDFLSLRDMIDGGGAGASGSSFKGGGLSDLMNGMGIKPLGSMQGMDQAQPMARPAGMPPAMQPMAPQPAPMASQAPGAVDVQTLIGSLSPQQLDQLLQMLQARGMSGMGAGGRI